MDIVGLLNAYLASADTLAQVLSTFYIAIAIFSGEQVATAFKSQQPQIRINPKRYISYLNLFRAGFLLIALPLVGQLHAVDVFPGSSHPLIKSLVGATVQTGIVAAIFWTIYDTLVHTKITRKFSTVTGSVSRLIAWALTEEHDKNESLKLSAVLLERTNDTDLDLLMLRKLDDTLRHVLANPGKHRSIEVLSTLRTVRATLDKRPLEDQEYYRIFFSFVHENWMIASIKRSDLHAGGFSQISSTLAAIAKELLKKSLGQGELGYDFFTALRAFLKERPEIRAFYFQYIGNELLLAMVKSPQAAFIWQDANYALGWRIANDKSIETQPYEARVLMHQYLQLVRRSQNDTEIALDTDLDIATGNLFQDIHAMTWGNLVTLWTSYTTNSFDATKAVEHWFAHPRRFALSVESPAVDHIQDPGERVAALLETLADWYENSILLAKNSKLFQYADVTKLRQAFKKYEPAPGLIRPEEEKARYQEISNSMQDTLKELQKLLRPAKPAK